MLVVRYEDLVADVSRFRAQVAALLGWAPPREIETVGADEVFLPRETAIKGDAVGEVDPAKVDAWRTELAASTVDAVESVTRRQMHRYGYAPTTSRAPIHPRQVRAAYVAWVAATSERVTQLRAGTRTHRATEARLGAAAQVRTLASRAKAALRPGGTT